MLAADIRRVYDLMSGSRSRKLLRCFRSPGIQAIVNLRFGQWVSRQNLLVRVLLTPLYHIQFHRIRTKWGIEIPRAAQVGEGLYIGHFGGIIIATGAVIGKNATLSHQVTIGLSGQGDRKGCPTVGDNVYFAPGAKVFGKIHIGNNVKIGANAVVYKDIPSEAVVVSYPGYRIISYKGNPGT